MGFDYVHFEDSITEQPGNLSPKLRFSSRSSYQCVLPRLRDRHSRRCRLPHQGNFVGRQAIRFIDETTDLVLQSECFDRQGPAEAEWTGCIPRGDSSTRERAPTTWVQALATDAGEATGWSRHGPVLLGRARNTKRHVRGGRRGRATKER